MFTDRALSVRLVKTQPGTKHQPEVQTPIDLADLTEAALYSATEGAKVLAKMYAAKKLIDTVSQIAIIVASK